ncbi:MAG: flagellar basal body rod protein FlgB [Candidatus Manganitrophus sp.]|nr:flagellar basal body rod protein FlgB [Candidatus Manganitrophus morganii]MDC4205737.1 flagellar basal body rod protein FlgB [Candidatus Manganitrophus sp.]MDC4226349.1 flagellar basal body rod protein FlgB [Candidatus Manganitrophus sp.]WDT72436.1 MAG: flagellar basal body rod protein FlgB [Candidatus Manganitrophus sp.]WDT75326.1 MAG: flagellar basal body rod protein FlgB [Candidatus Manganitrophus sp.]
MISSLFSKTIGLLGQALDLRSERHRVITANIANQDTPGYKAMEVNFKEALGSASGSLPLSLDRTDAAHLSSGGSVSASSHAAVSPGASQRLDGNTVNGEQEMAKLAENTLFYTATTQILNGKFRGIRNAIREGR